MTIVEAARTVTGGIDTHGEIHVAAALDEVGGLLGIESFDANPRVLGPALLAGRLRGGREGRRRRHRVLWRRTGPFPRPAGVEVIEVDRHNRQDRRRQGKSDPLDAVEAARAALSGERTGQSEV